MDKIIRRVLQEMKKKDIVQDRLGELAGVSQSTINRFLNENAIPRIDTLVKIARALGVPVEYLITNNDLKAMLYLQLQNMTDEEIQNLLFAVEKERLWKESKRSA